MTEENWVRITRCENIPLREGRSVRIDGRDIAVFNFGNRVLAVENRCPHQGGPLADGITSGNTVVCPLHAWKIDLECGSVVKPAGSGNCVRAFQTRVEDGIVLLNVSELQMQNFDSPSRENYKQSTDELENSSHTAQ